MQNTWNIDGSGRKEQITFSQIAILIAERVTQNACLIDAFVETKVLALYVCGQENIAEKEQEEHFDGTHNQVDFGVVFSQLVDLILNELSELVRTESHLCEVFPIAKRNQQGRESEIDIETWVFTLRLDIFRIEILNKLEHKWQTGLTQNSHDVKQISDRFFEASHATMRCEYDFQHGGQEAKCIHEKQCGHILHIGQHFEYEQRNAE